MFSSTIFALVLSLVAFATLVVGDPGSIVTMKSTKITHNGNEYFDPWKIDIIKTKKSSQLTIKMPTKKQLPDTMQMKLTLKMKDQDPIEYVASICDAITDETIGKTFVDAGTPKDKFPKECPFIAGDWTILKWDPPAEKIPPGVEDGPITGTLMIMEEGKTPYVQIEYEAELSHAAPGMGR